MKIKRILSFVIVAFLALVLVACGGGSESGDNKETNLLDSYLLNLNSVIESDFVLDAQLKVGDKAYDLTWTSSDACIAIAKEAKDGTYTAVVTRPEEQKKVTLTVTLGKNTKSFEFTVNPYSVYDFTGAFVFEQDKAVVAADFDLPTEFTKWGKTATITWESLNTDLITIAEAGNKALVKASAAKKNVNLKATFSYGGETSAVRYTVTVFEEMDSMETINYWYTNTGVKSTLSGYVVAIATVFDTTYENISFYMIDDSMNCGYYVYRGLCNAETAAKIVPGAHVTCTDAVNTQYGGLWETDQKTANVTVDEDVAPINVNDTIKTIDDLYISGSPAYIYNQSTLVKLTGWQITELKGAPVTNDTTIMMTIARDGKTLSVTCSKYMEGYYSVKNADDATFKGIQDKYATFAVGDYIDVTGILTARFGDQIAVPNADSINKSTAPAESLGKAIAPYIEAFKLDAIVGEQKSYTLPAGEGNVAITWKLAKDSEVAKIEGNTLTITPYSTEAQFTLLGTYTNGAFSTTVYYVCKVTALDTSVKTIDVIKGLEKGTEVTTQGTVLAVNEKGFILADGKGVVYVNCAASTVEAEQAVGWKVGDTIKVEGKMDYDNVIELIPTATTKVEIAAQESPLPQIYAAADLDTYVAAEGTYDQVFVQITGKLSISEGNYYVTLEGTENKVALVGLSEKIKNLIADLDGKEITVSGYAIGHADNKCMNVMLTTIDSAVPVSAAAKAATGITLTVTGKVVAVSTRGYIVYDGTDCIYVYAKGAASAELQAVYFSEGDYVTITGVTGFYNVQQLVPTAADFAEEPETDYPLVKAEVMDVDAVKAYIASSNSTFPVKLVELNGKVSISNGYYNLIIGSGENTVSTTFSYISDEQKAEYEDGKEYKVYAYVIGHSSNKYMNFIPCTYTAPLEPYQEVYVAGAIYVNPAFTAENCSWGGQALTFGTDGFADLKAAIAAAADGATIYLQSGEYKLMTADDTENYQLNKSLTFYGPNADICGYAKQRHPEAVIIQENGTLNITYSGKLAFYGVEFRGKGIGYISHDYFLAGAGAQGITLKNCVAASITSFLKVKDQATGDYVVDNCYFHGINQFIAWMAGGTLTFTNNLVDGSDCGGVTNENGSAFRLRGTITAKFYHNTFLGNYGSYPGYIEPNVGPTGSIDMQYNNFQMVENFFFKNKSGSLTWLATLNNNIYTDGDNGAVAIPATVQDIAGITVDTKTFENVEALEAAWETAKTTLLN